jgi:putative two-component system response regulator
LSTTPGYVAEEAQHLAEASKLHDIGKIGIEDAILRKNGPLTREEWALMHQHTVIGAELLSGSPSPLLQRAERIALHHHERWGGTGYPYGLRGEEIPLEARIVMLCDQYDALRSVRPYKPAFEHAVVCDILLNGDGRTHPQHFDPKLLRLFRDLQSRFQRIWNEPRHDEEVEHERCA